MSSPPGFYGKLPVVGDFVQRRVGAEFVAPWDRWLQENMLAARAALDSQWLDHYRAAPSWRFLLAPGCIDYHGWIGLVTPSMDRVGRYFPITVVQPLPGGIDPLATLAGAAYWFAALEQLNRAAIDNGMDLERFDAALAAIGAAPAPRYLQGDGEDATMPLPQSRTLAPLAWPGRPGQPDAQLTAYLAILRRPALFTSEEAGMVLAVDGLPGADCAVALVDCQWSAHGWRQQDPGAAPSALAELPAAPAAAPASAAPASAPAEPERSAAGGVAMDEFDMTRPFVPKSD